MERVSPPGHGFEAEFQSIALAVVFRITEDRDPREFADFIKDFQALRGAVVYHENIVSGCHAVACKCRKLFIRLICRDKDSDLHKNHRPFF